MSDLVKTVHGMVFSGLWTVTEKNRATILE